MSNEVDPNSNQPLPIPNDNPSIHDLVMNDLLKRKEHGLKKYGSLLQATNGRDSLLDSYEEALDLCCYLKQAIEERDIVRKMVSELWPNGTIHTKENI